MSPNILLKYFVENVKSDGKLVKQLYGHSLNEVPRSTATLPRQIY